jgi:hypothetical protein
MTKIRNKDNNQKKIIFIITALILFSFIIYSLIFSFSIIDNMLAAAAVLAIIYLYDRKFNISLTALILLCIAILLNPLGTFGLYSYFILFGNVGYDKLIHLFSSFAISYGLLEGFKGRKTFLTFAAAILVVCGLGSVNEISEFIGYRYFGVDNGGIFTTFDTLPVARSDLQAYDTYFDLIFNLAGAFIASIYMISMDKFRNIKKISSSYDFYNNRHAKKINPPLNVNKSLRIKIRKHG